MGLGIEEKLINEIDMYIGTYIGGITHLFNSNWDVPRVQPFELTNNQKIPHTEHHETESLCLTPF